MTAGALPLHAAAGLAVMVAGALLLVVAAWGVVRLPDALSRQHAATKAGTVALSLVCVGGMVWAWDAAWTGRLLAVVGFLLATLPIASHLLARAAAAEAGVSLDVRDHPGVPRAGLRTASPEAGERAEGAPGDNSAP